MGHHYVPRWYLRRFESDSRPKYIWLYDRKNEAIREAPIRDVAQKSGFYEPEVEKFLGEQIEAPGNRVLKKLHTEVRLSEEEITDFAKYLGAMICGSRLEGLRPASYCH